MQTSEKASWEKKKEKETCAKHRTGHLIIIIIDGLNLIPWRIGRPLIWDVTVVSPLAASYVDIATTNAGTVADMAATRKKTEKYSSLSSTYLFELIAVENLGAFSSSPLNMLSDLINTVLSRFSASIPCFCTAL